MFSIVLLLRRRIDDECDLVAALSGHGDNLIDRGQFDSVFSVGVDVQKQLVSSLRQVFEDKLPAAIHLGDFDRLSGYAPALSPATHLHPRRQRTALDLHAPGDDAIAVGEDQAHAGNLVARVDVEFFDLDAVVLYAQQRDALWPAKAHHDARPARLDVG